MSQHLERILGKSFAILLFLALITTAPASAQMEDQNALHLAPQPEPDLPAGNYAFAEGSVGGAPHRFYLTNLSVLQPVTVTLIARSPGDEIGLALGKYRYDEPDRTAATGSEGVVYERLRTEGELKIEVAAAGDPKPYLLSVWVGEAVQPDLPPVLVPASQVEGAGVGGGGFQLGGSLVLWVIAALLLAILALLTKVVLNKGKST